ncbi:MAG: HAD-IIIA family hydrolase [Flavobacteriales bacterium]|nr:HAD-IIIA family hydrolase [Flavobacteriales bacterium]
MRKGLFLDRDGVINREHGAHTTRFEDFEILPDAPEAIAAANAAGWTVVVITNQSGIDLGLYDHDAVDRMHHYLHDMLHRHGTHVADILYCPHHPQHGRCLCRKPGGLLLQRAAARHGLELSASVMIGDRERDVEAAAAAGARGILVPANVSLMETLRTNGLV